MKAVITADWHIGLSPPLHRRHTEDIRSSVRHVVDHAVQIGADYFILAGDGLDRPTKHGTDDLLFIEEQFSRLVDHNVTVIYSLGNHDSHRQPIAKVFRRFVTFFDKENYVESNTIRITPSMDMVIVPYLGPDMVLPEFGKPEGFKRIAIIHQTVGAARLGGGRCADTLENPKEKIFTNEDIVDRLKADLVFSGHVHSGQEVDMHGVPVKYVGSPAILKFGEAGESNGFVVFDDDYGWDYHSIPQRKWHYLHGIPDEIDEDAVYRLVVTEEERLAVPDIRQKMREAGSTLVRIDDAERDHTKKTMQIEGILEMNDEEQLRAYVENQAENADIDRLLEKHRRLRHDPISASD